MFADFIHAGRDARDYALAPIVVELDAMLSERAALNDRDERISDMGYRCAYDLFGRQNKHRMAGRPCPRLGSSRRGGVRV